MKNSFWCEVYVNLNTIYEINCGVRRSLLGAFLLGALALGFPCQAQQPAKVWRIGFLSPSAAASVEGRLNAFRAGMREYGYVEGKNLAMEFRWADDKNERLPAFAEELVRLKPDVIVTFASAGVSAAKGATATIPIVMANAGDAVSEGLVASLARPGGNVTGSNWLSLELYEKRLELLKEVVPRARRLAFLRNTGSTQAKAYVAVNERAAKLLKVEFQEFTAGGPNDFAGAFAAMAKGRVEALSVQDSPAFISFARPIAELAAKHRLPSAAGTAFAEAGGLIGYGPNFEEIFRRAAYFVDRIFKGAKPADLPVELPTRFEMVINTKTAKQIGVTIPRQLLVRADRLIE